MVTIDNTEFSSAQSLAAILSCKTKEAMVKIANRLDLYISPNIAKAKMATRLAEEILSNPIEIVSRLSRTELLLLEEFLTAGKDTYIVKKARKSEYMLQKWCLILTYEDTADNKWHLLMPDEVRTALSTVATPYIELAKSGQKGPTAKELRLRSFMSDLLGHNDFTVIGNTVINHRAKDNPGLDGTGSGNPTK